MSRTGSKPRDHLVLNGWVEYLTSKYKVGNKKVLEKIENQDRLRLADMVWHYGSKSRLHEFYAGRGQGDVFSYSHQELDRAFGRARFKGLNKVVGMFDVLSERFGSERGSTRGYILHKFPERLVKDYRQKATAKNAPDYFLDGNGRKVNTPPKAIDPKKADGSGIKLWRGVDVTNIVPVQVDRLYLMIDHYQKRLSSLNTSKPMFGAEMDRGRIERIIDDAASIVLAANTDLGGFPMRYVEAASGRLYAREMNLQQCVREVRHVALSGFLDLDIKNCHYTVMVQLAQDLGEEYRAIGEYVDDPEKVRKQLMHDLSMSRDQVKQALLMLVYDAPRSSSPFVSLSKAVGGQEKASEILEHPTFKAISDECRHAANLLSQNAINKSQGGSIMNVAGCGLKLSKKPQRKKVLAHILQGAEAVLLKEAVTWIEAQSPRNVVLLQHDGLTCKVQPDVQELQQHLHKTTGLAVSFKVEQLQPPAS